MLFYPGFDDLYYLHHFERAFISVNRLWTRRSHFSVNNWILDSGAFTEITTHGRYRNEPKEYAVQIEKWRHCGGFEIACSQDWMCEPFVTNITGFTVLQHQQFTIERYEALKSLTDAPIMPVIQGFKPNEYVQHVGMYGDLLEYGARVGVGSICKRNSEPRVIEYILRQIKAIRPDLKLHGFGLKLTALNRPCIQNLLYSADSMAWSFNARKNGRSAHDWREAKAFENRINRKHETELCFQN